MSSYHFPSPHHTCPHIQNDEVDQVSAEQEEEHSSHDYQSQDDDAYQAFVLPARFLLER